LVPGDALTSQLLLLLLLLLHCAAGDEGRAAAALLSAGEVLGGASDVHGIQPPVISSLGNVVWC